MDLIRRLVLSVILMLLTVTAYAGKDPIGWSMSSDMPAIVEMNHSYSIHFVLTNNLPFTMPTALKISNNSSPLSEVTMTDGCSGLKLTSGQTCTVGLVLVPKTEGKKELSVFMEYGKNKVRIPDPVATARARGEDASTLQGIVLNGFPSAILSNTTYPLSFKFKNNGSTTLSNLVLDLSSKTTSGYTQGGTTNCSSLSPGGECIITGSFITTATSGNVLVSYTATSGTVTGNVTTSSVVNNTTGKGVRTITFVNNCSSTVYFGAVSANVNGNPCKTTKDCTYPALCNPSANKGAGYCFYPAPAPSSGDYTLSTSGPGQTRTALVTDYGLPFVWSGNIAGRTGCTGSSCQTADCGGGTGACPTGVGFDQPATLAEFTMLRDSVDNYDISILNGTNIGIQITPTTNYTFANDYSPAEYNCTSPGKASQSNGLGNCPWTFTPPSTFPTAGSSFKYRYVTNTSNAGCTDATSCPGGTVCGLYYDRTASPTTLNSYCGTLLGYNTANQVCSFKNTSLTVPSSADNPGNAYFNCDTASGVTSAGDINGTTKNLPVGTAYTNWGLYACVAQPNDDLGTCFNTSTDKPPSTTNCCGCVDWASYGSGIVVPSSTLPCQKNNTTWYNNVLPGVVFMKLACPTAYSWPFDDKASLFGCSDKGGSRTTNQVNYTITFCPT